MSGFAARNRARHGLTLGVAALVVGVLLMGGTPGSAAATPAPGAGVTAVRVRAVGEDVHRALAATGLDVVEHGLDWAEVWLHTPADVALLRDAGFTSWTTLSTRRQAAQLTAQRAEEDRLAAALADDPSLASELPTGRVSYRTLAEAEAEIRELAAQHPGLTRLIELPNRSLLGSPVLGVEIAHDVAAEDGRPTYLLTGMHHSREWPTVELTLEFAWDVARNQASDPRISSLLDRARLIIVPIVNPDGFDMSRSRIHEQKRKNCRIAPGQTPTREQCMSAANANAGVDLNRNYGAFWSGPGSGRDPISENHYGEAPYSEPEIRNIAALTGARQVTVAISNHTPDGRLLRAPSSSEEPVPADVAVYDALAQQLGAVTGWPAGPWPEIYYEASGVAEQHAYYTAGTLAFTTEMTPGFSGLERFHPPYAAVIEQYGGTGRYVGSHIREAFLVAWEAAADPARHGVLTATARPGSRLTLTKDLTVDSSCPLHPLYPQTRPAGLAGCPVAGTPPLVVVHHSPIRLASTMTVPADGAVAWHVNPSGRPNQLTSTTLDEAWTLTCTGPSGQTGPAIAVRVGRGQQVPVDLSTCPA